MTTITQTVITCSTGIHQFANNTVSIYPNPATDLINIQFANISESSILEIYNYLGQKVSSVLLNKNDTQLNISGLNSGIYEARVISNNTVIRQIKIVKQ
jgi:hypothetical protein